MLDSIHFLGFPGRCWRAGWMERTRTGAKLLTEIRGSLVGCVLENMSLVEAGGGNSESRMLIRNLPRSNYGHAGWSIRPR